MRIVAKFGGTSLATGDRIERAADAVADAVAAGHEVLVVASAMGDRTDELVEAITFPADAQDRAEILSMGERTSVRLLKAAIAARDVPARFLEPGDADWPVRADADGEIDEHATRERATDLAATLDESVPVVAGFLAEGPDGTVHTLERGGSDTTALMLANHLEADEAVIVTDVEGVMTGDPRIVDGARNLGTISVEELRTLSFRGAEVLAPRALAYKEDWLPVRVVHYQHGDLLSGGTRIEGEFDSLVHTSESPIASLTVAGRAMRDQPGILQDLAAALGEAGVNIDAVASGIDSVTFYVDETDAAAAETILHDEVVQREPLSGVSLDENLAVVRATGGEFPDQPGVLYRMLEPLAEAGINVVDVVTSAASVAIFVDWTDREAAFERLRERVE